MPGARRVPFARSFLLTTLAGGLVGSAWTTPAAQASDASSALPPLARPSLSHQSQIGLSVLPGSGLRVLFPYQEEVYCGQPGKRVCSGRLPTYLDVQPSFGLTAHWDLLLDLRFGLEADFARTHAFALAPGLRYWIEPLQRLKFFTTLQAAFDFTEQHTHVLAGYDLAFHNSNGLMFEVMRDLGFYAQLGETIGFVRWLRFEVDVGAGVQARFP
jgi:hypothetical protein